MISERLSEVYSNLEEKYYGLLDFLDEKGVPVYSYNDFLEDRGLPAFPITVALIVLLLAAVYGLLFVGNLVSPEITLTFSDQFDDVVSSVSVSVKDSQGNILLSPESVSNGESVRLSGIPLGTEVTVAAEKQGFKQAEQKMVVRKDDHKLAIALEREYEAIVARLLLVDADTGDPIQGASVTAEWRGITKTGVSDGEGRVELTGIPSNVDVFVTITGDGYETTSSNYLFYAEQAKTISLVASSASLSGSSKLLVSVVDEEGNPVNSAKAEILDRSTDTPIEERTLTESEGVFTISKGKSIRLVVKKDGFLRYDSLETGESRTMRSDDELWPVILKKGGSMLVVSVLAGQVPLEDAVVQLYDLEGNLVDSSITGFGGSVDFTNLEPVEYYVTAYKQGFLPSREKVNVAGTESVSFSIEAADTSNSSYVGISVLDAYKAMADNADLFFYEKVDSEIVPLGIPSLKTDVSGYASIKARPGTMLVVEAVKDLQEGVGEKLVEANKENQLVIELSKPVNVVELQVLDAEGNPVAGLVTIETVSGEILFEGETADGRVFFDSEGNNDVVVKVTTADGETFSQKVSLAGRGLVQVTLGEGAAGIAPTITFTGIFNEFGEEVEGIGLGEDYWLGFSTSWPAGIEKGGVHVRAGSDSIEFVDSQEIGITGFEATTSDYFYGQSYQPLPEPGNETADKQNIGMPGQMNKLLELYFEAPENSVVFKVRARANPVTAKEKVEVHFRAWSEAGGAYFRAPLDSELGEERYVATKTGFYAETSQVEVPLSVTDAECQDDLCANYFFVLPNGLYVEKQEFKAVTEELYALEIDLTAKKPLNVTLKLDTDKASPKIKFTGYEIDNFVDQQTQEPMPPETGLSGQGYAEFGPEEALVSEENPLGFRTGSETTSLTISGLGVSQDRSRKVRAYFKGVEEGTGKIMLQSIGEGVLSEEFVFEVERNKELVASLAPKEPGPGEAFTVTVLDGEDGSYVEEASVKIKNKQGEVVNSLVGSGSTRRGHNGEYYFRTGLKPGFYTIEVSASGYKTAELELLIARDGLLKMQSPIKVDIEKEERQKTVSAGIHNTAKEAVESLTYEIEKDGDFPEEFAVTVTMPEAVPAGQDITASIQVVVNLNDESAEDLYGEANLVLSGMVAGNYPTTTTARIEINYNKPLEEDCLYFDKEHLLVKMIGRAGSSASEEFEAENKCGVPLNLKASVEERVKDPNLAVTVSPLRLEKNAVETVTVKVSNRIDRMYNVQERRDYKLKFESSQIAKTIPLSVELWNPMTNLAYPPSVSLWMVRAAQEETAYAQAPLQVYNNGPIPVTAFRMAVTPEAHMQGITAGIKPAVAVSGQNPYAYGNTYSQFGYGNQYGQAQASASYGTGTPTALGGSQGIGSQGYTAGAELSGITINPHSPLTPQRVVYAESERSEALQKPGQGWIQYIGVIAGRMYPDLGRTSLAVNYSGVKCLEAQLLDSATFTSTEVSGGTLERNVKVANKCGEPVRLTGKLNPETVLGNALAISPPITLPAGQSADVKLILIKSQEANREATIAIQGILVAHNQPIESNKIQVRLKLGKLAATAEGHATGKSAMPVCEDEDAPAKMLAFPILSEDCGNGYCDAQQLGEYLTEKLDNIVKMAKGKVGRSKNQASMYGRCANQHYCDLQDLGILTDPFPVFLQLDTMTEDVLSKALKEESKTEIKDDYLIVQGQKSVESIGDSGFDFGQINLGGIFKGCGKYLVKIEGAMRVDNGEILVLDDSRNFMFSVNITQERVDTDECLHLIQNVSNFLPVDEGFTIEQNHHAWPGFVEGGSEFGDLPEEFAKEMFGNAEGRHAPMLGSESNKLKLVKGDSGGGLLKIRIAKTGSPEKQKTVYAHVPSEFSPENTKMAREIAKALSSFKAHAFSEGDCWGEDETGQYIVMKSFTDIEELYGKLKISGDKTMRINNKEQCIDLTISSKVAEKVTFNTTFLDQGNKQTGIEYVAIKDEKGSTLLEMKANKNISVGKELELTKKGTASLQAPNPGTGNNPVASNPPGGQPTGNQAQPAGNNEPEQPSTPAGDYSAKFKFCIKGSDRFALAMENVPEISVIGISTAGTKEQDRKTEPHKVKIEVCGIHPKELVKKIVEREKNLKPGSEETYYATVGWKGNPEPPETLSANKLRRMIALEEAQSGMVPDPTSVPTKGLTPYEEKMQGPRAKSIGAYFAGCAPVAYFTPWGSVIFDCALPAAWALLDVFDATARIKDTIVGWVKSILGPLADVVIAPILNGISKLFGGDGDLSFTGSGEPDPYAGATNKEELAEQNFNELLNGAYASGGTYHLIQGMKAAGTTVTSSSARALLGSYHVTSANGLARAVGPNKIFDQFAEEFVAKKVPGLPTATANKLREELSRKAREEAEALLFEKGTVTGRYTRLKPNVRGKPLAEIAEQAINNSYAKSQSQFDDILGSVMDRTLTGGDPAEIAKLRRAIQNRTDAIFDTRRMADDVMSGLRNESLDGLTDRQLKDLLKRRMISAMEADREVAEELWTSFGSRQAFEDEIRRAVNDTWTKTTRGKSMTDLFDEIGQTARRNGLSTKGKSFGQIFDQLSSAEKARFANELSQTMEKSVNDSVGRFSARNNKLIYRGLKKEVNEQLVTKMGTSYADDAGKIVKQGLDNPKFLTKLGRFAKGLGGGILAGVAANAAGMLLHGLYWDNVPEVEADAELKTTELVNVLDADGTVIGTKEVQSDVELLKHQSYKIVISKGLDKKANTEITPIRTQEQYEEMFKAIKDKPESNWNTDCTNYAKQPVKLLMGTLAPTATTGAGGNVKQEHAVAYINNEEIIRYYADQYALAEELIIAILLEQPENIKGCAVPKDWWKQSLSPDERNEIVGCAVARLHESLSAKNALAEFTNASDKPSYVQKISALQREWNKFRTLEAS